MFRASGLKQYVPHLALTLQKSIPESVRTDAGLFLHQGYVEETVPEW